MKLKVAELKKFKAAASSIKTNTILPVLSYLRFAGGYVTKNNVSAFVSQAIEHDGDFLVDEQTLMNYISRTSSPTIELKIIGDKIHLTGGKGKSISSTDDIKNFPEVASTSKKKVELTGDILNAIKIASSITELDEKNPIRSHVFVGNKMVSGSNGFIAFIQDFDDKLPDMVIRKDVAALIGTYESLFFSENDSFMLFEQDELKFGFGKTEQKFIDFTPHKKYVAKGSFTLNKNELIDLNLAAIGQMKVSALNRVCESVIEIKGEELIYSSVDKSSQFEFNDEIGVENTSGVALAPFKFNAEFMTTLLKALPEDELMFEGSGKGYYMTGTGKKFLGLIMGFADSNNQN